MKTIILFCFQVFLAASLLAQSNRGLVVYYPLNGNTLDSSGYSNNGYRGSGTALSTDIAGKAGMAYSYDGTSGATIDAFASATINTADMTNVIMSVWIKPGSGNTGFPEETIATLVHAASRTHYALTYTFADDKVGFRNFDGPNLAIATSLVSINPLARDTWHHVAIRIDSLNKFTLFINGMPDASVTAAPVKPTNNTLTVGRNPIAPVSNNLSFLGTIDEVNIYDGFLTDAEIHEKFYQPYYCYGNSTGSTNTVAACYTYTVPSGHETYTTSGTYTDTLPNALGCDSIITINLTINTIDTGITVSKDSLMANEQGASYQWLDCNNNFAPLANKTAQVFVPVANGNYAAAITENGCTDTSGCIQVLGVGINDVLNNKDISVYPNPASTELTIAAEPVLGKVTITLLNSIGKKVTETVISGSHTIPLDGFAAGVYILKAETETGTLVHRIIIK